MEDKIKPIPVQVQKSSCRYIAIRNLNRVTMYAQEKVRKAEIMND